MLKEEQTPGLSPTKKTDTNSELPFGIEIIYRNPNKKTDNENSDGSKNNGQIAVERTDVFCKFTFSNKQGRQTHPPDNQNTGNYSNNCRSIFYFRSKVAQKEQPQHAAAEYGSKFPPGIQCTLYIYHCNGYKNAGYTEDK